MLTLIVAVWAFSIGLVVGGFASYDAATSIPEDEEDYTARRMADAARRERQQVDALIYSCGGLPPQEGGK